MNIRIRLACCILATALLSGCGQLLFWTFELPKEESELHGTYEQTYPFGSQTIILSGDHRFVQEVVYSHDAKNERATSTGTWSYNPKLGHIMLRDAFAVAQFGAHDGGINNVRGPRDFAVIRNRFTKKIVLEADENSVIPKIK